MTIERTASESGGRRDVRDQMKTPAAVRTVMIPDIAMPAVRRLAARGAARRERSGGRLCAGDRDPRNEDLLRSFGAVNKGLRQWVRSHMGAEPGMTTGRAGVLLGLLERDEPGPHLVRTGRPGATTDVRPMPRKRAGLRRCHR